MAKLSDKGKEGDERRSLTWRTSRLQSATSRSSGESRNARNRACLLFLASQPAPAQIVPPANSQPPAPTEKAAPIPDAKDVLSPERSS
jgi:hypothetical protein